MTWLEQHFSMLCSVYNVILTINLSWISNLLLRSKQAGRLIQSTRHATVLWTGSVWRRFYILHILLPSACEKLLGLQAWLCCPSINFNVLVFVHMTQRQPGKAPQPPATTYWGVNQKNDALYCLNWCQNFVKSSLALTRCVQDKTVHVREPFHL